MRRISEEFSHSFVFFNMKNIKRGSKILEASNLVS